MKSTQLSSPPRLFDLPTEILLLIFSHFCLHCREPNEVLEIYYPNKQQEYDQPSWYSLDLQALYSICLVSRRFRDIAQPILYHEFVPGYGDSCISQQYSWTGRLFCFFRTVTLRPDLADLVQRFYLSHWLLDVDIMGQRRIQAILEESARVRDINLSEFLRPFHSLPARECLGIYRPAYEELVAMLLSFLPNLIRLYLTRAVPSSPIPVESLSVAGTRRMRLKSIEIDASNSNLRTRLGGILDMSVSTLTSLNINSYCSYNGDKLGISGVFFPNLRTISVTMSGMIGSDLESLLSRCTGLETFIYDSTSIIFCIRPSMIIKYLNRHRDTLTTLRLDLRDARITHERFLHERIFSLRSFPVLSHVSLNLLFVYNSTNEHQQDDNALCQLLPSSIISLQLYDTVGTPAGARLSQGLLQLIDAVSQGQFSRLKSIRCFVREQIGGYDISMVFKGVGIELEMILGPPSDVVPRWRGSTASSLDVDIPTANLGDIHRRHSL
ncbi:hypothetical protein F5Y08DRAFT_140901 [Xylaria arbuscula]|nr:hypothetical protein F5Y08DRAFT_140901 [Xylaria arbuscula]